MEEWVERSTFHGLRQLFVGKWKHRVLWFLVISILTLSMCFTFNNILSHFFSGHLTTSIYIDDQESTPIPDIYICHPQPLRLDYVRSRNISDGLVEYIVLGLESLQCPITLEKISKQMDRHERELKALVGDDLDGFFLEAGPRCEDVLEWCVVGLFQFNCCSPLHMRRVPDFNYGSCFLLSNLPTQLWPNAGLKLSLMRRNHLYTKLKGRGEGMAVKMGYASDYTPIRVAPLHITSVNLFPSVLRRSNGLFTTACNASSPFTSEWSCRMACHSKIGQKLCNCTGSLCSPAVRLKCLQPFLSKFPSCPNSCLPSCLQRLLSVTVSQTVVEEEMGLQVQFPTFQTTVLQQTESTTVFALIANLGGGMGVFIGASILSLLELLFLPAAFFSRNLYSTHSTQ